MTNQDKLFRLGDAIADSCAQVPDNFRSLNPAAASRELRFLLDRLEELIPARDNVKVPERSGPGGESAQNRGVAIEAFLNVWQVCGKLDTLVKAHREGVNASIITPQESLPAVMEQALLLASRCLLSRSSPSAAATQLYRSV